MDEGRATINSAAPLRVGRRAFVLGGTAVLLGLAGCNASAGSAEPTPTGDRTVTTALGTYQIPAGPQRVIAVDSRLDLEPAVALRLPVVGFSYGKAEPWVPVGADVPLLKVPPSIEEIAAKAPDLIICTDVGDPTSEYWPIGRLKEIAPVLPLDYTKPWRTNLQQLVDWLGLTDTEQAKQAVAGYDAEVRDLTKRFGSVIKDSTIAIVQYSEDGVWPSAAEFTSQQVARDLGVTVLTIPDSTSKDGDRLQAVSREKYDVFDRADGMLVTTGAELAKAIDADKVWNRVPAVRAGHVAYSNGNINYGSVYTATEVLRLYDQLFTSMSS